MMEVLNDLYNRIVCSLVTMWAVFQCFHRFNREFRRGDSCPLPTRYYLCIVSSPCLNRYISLYERSSDSSFDSLCFECPKKPIPPRHEPIEYFNSNSSGRT